MQSQVSNVPGKVATLTTNIDDMTAQFNRLLQLDPVRDRIVELKENTLPKLKQRLEDNSKHITEIKTEETQVMCI